MLHFIKYGHVYQAAFAAIFSTNVARSRRVNFFMGRYL